MKITTIDVPGYERVARAEDPASGLLAFIGVHDTTLGPALGGLRMWKYESEQAALTDVLRLSRGMTYKSAVAKTGLGGGKSVIVGDSRKDKTPALMQAMGRFIDTLGGQYITAEDVGTGIDDLKQVRKATRFVTGLSREDGGSGNPSPYTALGCFVGIQAAAVEAWGSDALQGRVVAIQGPGSVGFPLGQHLVKAGAKLIVADVSQENLDRAVQELGAKAVPPQAIYDEPCDIFAPCALGGILNDETIPRLKCRIIGGAANNQLLDENRHAQALKDRDILYAPDYVINAGGIINVSLELEPGGYDETKAVAKIRNIFDALRSIFETAKRRNVTTHAAAQDVAEANLRAGAGGSRRAHEIHTTLRQSAG
ncbi:MAG TPA: Glu/Leu/Phe/Val dehydrogenase dimerization domain-containing protein [Planctomycetota bacterium]|nr:Glu/Leu/Phe/Val dehydrogenase dimerization domain-containing protein [Planctomycetota bacterium]